MFSKLWDFLDGKKLYIGGVGTILTGLGKLALDYSNGGHFSLEGWQMILAGWAMIGAKSALAKVG